MLVLRRKVEVEAEMKSETLQALIERYRVEITVEELLFLALKRIRAERLGEGGGHAGAAPEG